MKNEAKPSEKPTVAQVKTVETPKSEPQVNTTESADKAKLITLKPVEPTKPAVKTAAIRPIVLKSVEPSTSEKKSDLKEEVKSAATSDLDKKKQELIQKINSMSSIEQL